ncbi:MAG TPA: AtpZ/AtpI family protein [Acetobacteraceae bacterium]|nr:AtpZ/AtpI family protein [Acetobacteraceae bacterium]
MDKDKGRQPSFEERLRVARERQGLEPRRPAPGDQSDQEPSALGIGLRVAVELVSALVVACAIGWGVDRLLGTRPIFLIVFIPLGGAAGILNVWRTFAPRPEKPGKTARNDRMPP